MTLQGRTLSLTNTQTLPSARTHTHGVSVHIPRGQCSRDAEFDSRPPARSQRLAAELHSDGQTRAALCSRRSGRTAASPAAPASRSPPPAPPGGPPLTSAGSGPPARGGHGSRGPAPKSCCRRRRDPRARRPHPPWVAPAPAGSGGSERTLDRLWNRPAPS